MVKKFYLKQISGLDSKELMMSQNLTSRKNVIESDIYRDRKL